MISFKPKLQGRNLTNENNEPAAKAQAFNSVIKYLTDKGKKIDPYRFFDICALSTQQNAETPPELSPQTFGYMTELAKNTGTNFFTIKKYTAGFTKFLAIGYLCMKGRDAFINSRFDHEGFKLFISTNPTTRDSINVADISDKYLEGITIDHDGLVCFGRRNYNQCTVNIDAPFITKTYSNGDKYVGEFADELRHGQGTMFYSNGDKYVGEFDRGLKHGEGTMIYSNGDRYVGKFANGFCDGKGTYTLQNGEKYVGEFDRGLIHGKGTYTLQNGTKYVGEFFNGLRHGQGTYTYPDGEKYVGEFFDGLRHGQGTFTFSNGDRYVGKFANGFKHGQGTYTFSNGNIYVGEFASGLIHGKGTYTLQNGDIYVGEYRDGKNEGTGTYTFLDGTKYTGIAQNGRNVEIERQFFIDLIMSKEKFNSQQIKCFCKFMVHGYNSQDVTQLSTLNDLQQFYKQHIANNLVQLNEITKEKLRDSTTQDIIPENSMVLVLSSLVENQLEIITQDYLLNAMVASLTTTITDGGLNSKNYERSPINNLPISRRIIPKSELTANFINSKNFLS